MTGGDGGKRVVREKERGNTLAFSSVEKFSVALPMMRESIMDPLERRWKYWSHFSCRKLHATSLPCGTPAALRKTLAKRNIKQDMIEYGKKKKEHTS